MLRRALLPAFLLVTPPLIALTAAPQLAWADAAPRKPTLKERNKAAALKKKGDAAMVALGYDDALAAYTEAYEITGDPALLYNRGRAFQGLGRFPDALEQLEAFSAQAPPKLKARVPALGELITEVRAKIATLTIGCKVDGARVLVADKVVGTTPLDAPLKLNSGLAALQVEADGYFPYRKIIELPGGGKLTVEVPLVPKSTVGILVIRSSVAGARAVVNDSIAGNVPLEISVNAGSHKIVVERDGYLRATTSAVVTAGGRKEVTVPLEKAAPVTQHWWFWAGIGAAVIGGAVLTGALLTERSPSEGDISPGKVSAPIRF